MFFIKILTILSISSSGRSAGMVMWISFIYIVQYTRDSKRFASKSLFVLIFLIQIHKKIFIQNEYKYVNMPVFLSYVFTLDLPISQNTLLENLPALGREFRLSVEFKASSTNSGGMNSVMGMSNYGPSVFVKHDDKKVRKVEILEWLCPSRL